MKRLIYFLFLAVSLFGYSQELNYFVNREQGSSVRTKLNTLVDNYNISYDSAWKMITLDSLYSADELKIIADSLDLNNKKIVNAADPQYPGDLVTKRYFDANSSSGAWGSITGTLSNQTDLQAALDAKTETDTTLTEAEVDAFVANNGYLTSEVDGSTTNEIQGIDNVLSQNEAMTANRVFNLNLNNLRFNGLGASDEFTITNYDSNKFFELIGSNGSSGAVLNLGGTDPLFPFFGTARINATDLLFNGMEWPSADGANGQFLQTDGAGNLSWQPAGGSFTLTNGKGTTANGTAVDLGGAIATEEAVNITGADDTQFNVTLDPSGDDSDQGGVITLQTGDDDNGFSTELKMGDEEFDLKAWSNATRTGTGNGLEILASGPKVIGNLIFSNITGQDNSIAIPDDPALAQKGSIRYDNASSGLFEVHNGVSWETIGDGTGTDDQTATEVPFTPYSTIAATNVQAAIQEVLDESTGGTDDQIVDQFDITSNTLNLSLEADGVGPNTVDLSPYLDNTDAQDLTLVGNTLAISGDPNTDVDLSGYLDNTDTQLTEEQVEDFAGGMVTGNTETLIAVTYDDAGNSFDFVVDNDLSNYDNATSGFISNTVEDVTPQFGGNVDGQNNQMSNVNFIPRSNALTSGATLTPDAGFLYNTVTLAEATTINAPTGGVDLQQFALRIYSTGTHSIAWNAIYQTMGNTLPTTTVANKTIYVFFTKNDTTSTFDLNGVQTQD